MPRQLVLAMVATGALAAAPAQAATPLTSIPRALGGHNDPFLYDAAIAGGNLAEVSGGQVTLISTTGATRSVSLPDAAGLPNDRIFLAGSSSRLAALLDSGPASHGELLAGPAAGPMTQIDACAASPVGVAPAIPPPLAPEAALDQDAYRTTTAVPVLDGDTLAYIRGSCAGGSGPAIVVRDFASSGPGAVLALPSGVVPGIVRLSLAGDYVAYAAGTNIVVENWRTGTVTYSAPSEAPRGCTDVNQFMTVGSPTPAFCGLAVDRDGSLWELTGELTLSVSGQNQYVMGTLSDTCTGTIDRFPAGSAAPQHVVAGSACDAPLRVAGGAAVFESRTGAEAVTPASAPRPLGQPGPLYAFDGTTLVAEHATCTAQEVVAIAAASDSPLPSDTSTCPFRAGNARVLQGGHRLRLRISCPAGCVGPVVIGDAAAPSGFHHLETSSRNFTLAPGGHLTVTVALPRRGPLARAAARHRSIGIAIWRLRVTDDPRTPLRDVDETHPDQELKART